MKKKLLCFSGCILLLAAMCLIVKASERPNYRDGQYYESDVWRSDRLFVRYPDRYRHFYRMFFKAHRLDAFCIQQKYMIFPEEEYTVEEYTGDHTAEMGEIYNAYMDLGADDLHYMAAQVLIWDCLGDRTDLGEEPHIAMGIADIRAQIAEYHALHQPHLVLDAEIKAGQVNYLTDTSGLLSEGYVLDGYSEGLYNVAISGNRIRFQIAGCPDEEIYIKVKPQAAIVYPNSTSGILYSSKKSQNLFSFPVRIGKNYASATFSCPLDRERLTIEKEDEDGKTVNVGFNCDLYEAILNNESYAVGNKLNEAAFTLENGKIVIADLVPGHYFIKETECPDYLLLDEEFHLIEITPGCENKFKFYDQIKKADLNVYKYAADDNSPLKDTEFTLYDLTNEVESPEGEYLLKLQEAVDLSTLKAEDEEFYAPQSDYYTFNDNNLCLNAYTIAKLKLVRECMDFDLSDFTTIYTYRGRDNSASEELQVKRGEEIVEGTLTLLEIIEKEDNYAELIYLFKTAAQEYLIKRYRAYDPNLTFIAKIYEIKDRIKIYAVDSLQNDDVFSPIKSEKLGSVLTDENGTASFPGVRLRKDYLVCESAKRADREFNTVCQAFNFTNPDDHLTFYNPLKKFEFTLYKYSRGYHQQLLNAAEYLFKFQNIDGTTHESVYLSGALHLEQNDFQNVEEGDTVMLNGRHYPFNESLNLLDLPDGVYEIALYSADGELKETIKREKHQGMIFIQQLTAGGELTFKELKAPEGYELDKKEYHLKITADSEHYTLTNFRVNALKVVDTGV